jgi:hypothetical protein
MKFYMGGITALSLPGFLTQFGALRTAIDNLTLGTLFKEIWTGDSTVLSNIAPTDPNAQRELAYEVSMVDGDDGGGRVYTFTIACADTSKLIPGTDKVDLTDMEVAEFITAYETIATLPNDPESSVEIIGIRIIGRRY